MEPFDVERFAELENSRWQPLAETRDEASCGPARQAHEVDDALVSDLGSWRAYQPLDAKPDTAFGGLTSISGFRATATGQILVVAFRWLPDSEQREYLLHLDLAGYPSDELKPAETLLLETLVHVATRLGQGEQETIPVSGRVSIAVVPGV